MAALRDPDPDDRHAVPRPGTKEAARLDGAGPVAIFWHLTLPHLARPIAVVVMIETIFLLSVFAEIFTTTNGGPGYASTNLAYLIYNQALVQFDVGMASAGGLIAVVIANIAAIILVRMIGKNLTDKPEARHDASTIPPAAKPAARHPGLGHRDRDLLPDLLDGADQLQDRNRRVRHAAAVHLHADAGELPAHQRAQRLLQFAGTRW
jgi:hypothetical protein